MRWLWSVLFFLSDVSFWRCASKSWSDAMGCLTPLRLLGIGTFSMFWCLESYYIIITGIVWCDLHLNTPVIDYMTSIMLFNCICLLPCSIWNARHAWTLILTLNSITILHQRGHEPIKPVHWACEHDVCFVICHLHNCLVTQVLSATRYVKISRKFIIPPRHGLYGRLEEGKRVCLKTSSMCHPSRSWPQHLFEILVKTAENVTSWM